MDKELGVTRGITLILLIITVILLIILSAVAITTLIGENGIITLAKKAEQETLKNASEENIKMSLIENIIESYMSDKNVSNIIKKLNLKGLYKIEEIQNKKIIDCIRIRENNLYREEIEIDEENFKVKSSNKVDTVEDIAIPLYLLLIEGDYSKIKLVGNEKNYLVIQYKDKKYKLIETRNGEVGSVYIGEYL